MTPGILPRQASETGGPVQAIIARRLAATRTSFAHGIHGRDFDHLVRAGMSAALRFGLGSTRERRPAEPLRLPRPR